MNTPQLPACGACRAAEATSLRGQPPSSSAAPFVAALAAAELDGLAGVVKGLCPVHRRMLVHYTRLAVLVRRGELAPRPPDPGAPKLDGYAGIFELLACEHVEVLERERCTCEPPRRIVPFPGQSSACPVHGRPVRCHRCGATFEGEGRWKRPELVDQLAVAIGLVVDLAPPVGPS